MLEHHRCNRFGGDSDLPTTFNLRPVQPGEFFNLSIMSKHHPPRLKGFEVHLVKCEFSQPEDVVDFDFGSIPNPLAGKLSNDPGEIIRQQERLMQSEIDAYIKSPDGPVVGNGSPVHIGIDSEWCQVAGQSRNLVLSYQFHLFSNQGELAGILFPKPDAPDRRVSFEDFLGFILQTAMHYELIEAWPCVAFVYAHFLRADITHFDAFWAVKNKVDGMRGTVTSVSEVYVADWQEFKQFRPKPLVLSDEHRHSRRTFVRFVDTLLLTPGGLGLDDVGKLIGLDKLVLPDGYEKSDMARFLRERRDEFIAYAMRDAEITVRYGLLVRQFVVDQLNLKGVPPTIGSMAARLCRRLLEKEHGGSDEFLRLFGREKRNSRSYWHEAKSRLHHVKKEYLLPARMYREQFAINCYLGGRNECDLLGPTEVSDYHDYDLVGAYTTGLLDLWELDYQRGFDSQNPQDYVGHVCGFAQVEFVFNTEVRQPCLPVYHEERGLYYPLKGTSYCTAPEIELALALGAQLKIVIGFVIPWRDNQPIMAPFVKIVRERRLQSNDEGKVFDEKLWKEIGNSVYGKTAQGLREKSNFDPRTGRGKTISPSDLTNPYFAAHTTGFIRAVISEIIARLPDHRQLISVTTDGFLTDAELHEIDLSGPLATRFQALLSQLDGSKLGQPKMLVQKHRVRQLIAMKTRGQLTALPYPGSELVVAKSSVKPPMYDRAQQNEYMIQLYLNRQPGQKHTTKHIISMSEQWHTESDLVEIRREQFLNLEFDFKRRPVNPRMVDVLGTSHLACDTIPWNTATEAEEARAIFDNWRKTRCLKTVEDFQTWEEYYELQQTIRHKGIRQKPGEDSVGILRRMFLRAYAQRVWGTEKVLSYAKLAAWLTDKGYPTAETEAKNAIRLKLVEHSIPLTAGVKDLLAVLMELQPNLDTKMFLAPPPES